MDAIHDILRFTRDCPQSIETVWAAYADVESRMQWSVPSGDEIVYDAADFTLGGQDDYRCGPPGDLSNFGSHRYHLIESPERLVYSDLVHRNGQLMAVALLTWEFRAGKLGTRVNVVDQVTSFVGQGMIEGHRNGHEKTLDQLIEWMA